MEELGNIIAAVPFSIEHGGKIFNTDETGFQKVIIGLEELGRKTAAGEKMRENDAIPSIAAHLLKMHSDMKDKNLEQGYQEERWRKCMVIFALSSYRAYRVSVDCIQKGKLLPDSWELFGKEIAYATGGAESVYILRFYDEDFAVLSQKGFLLPIAEFPQKIENELGENCIENLLDYERDALWTYFKKLDEQVQDNYYIKKFLASLEQYGAKSVDGIKYAEVGDFAELLSFFGGKKELGNCFFNIPSFTRRFPEVFCSSLLISFTDIDNKSNSIIGFGKTLTFQFKVNISEEPYHFSGFLPLTEKMVDFLENNKDSVRLQKVQVDDSEFLDHKAITIMLTFMVENQQIKLQKRFESEQIQFAKSVPLLMVFPYVDLPAEKWKCYYQVLKSYERPGSATEIQKFISEFDFIPDNKIDMLDEDKRRSTEADKEDDRETWYYHKRETLPLFIKMCIADFGLSDDNRNREKKAKYIGCIDVGKPEITQTDFHRTFDWALDMGTRNTIAAYQMKDSHEISYTLIRGNLFCTLLYAQGKINMEFARQCHAPFEEVKDSFPTMARIYREGMGTEMGKSYVDGCALFPDAGLMYMLLDKSENWSKSAILTDLKFGKQNNQHDKALHIYLHNMFWLGCLECVLNGASKIQIHVSYPKSDVLKRIQKIWDRIKEYVDSITDVRISIEYCSEAEANSRYLCQAINQEYSITENSRYGICDIGDGTSDFNLFLGNMEEGQRKRIQFSMRYAGRDILVDTLMRFSERKGIFEKFWEPPSDNTEEGKHQKELLDKYVRLEQKGEDRWESRRNVVLTLIESVGLRKGLSVENDDNLSDFTVVLSFKYWNLFRVYGEILKKFMPEAINFKLFLYGGGRLALKDTSGGDFADLLDTQFWKDILGYLSEQAHIDQVCFSAVLDEKGKPKTEVVDGLLAEDIGNMKEDVKYIGREIDEYYKTIHVDDNLPDGRLSRTYAEQLLEGYLKYIEEIKDKKYFNLKGNLNAKHIYEAIYVGNAEDKEDTLKAKNFQYFMQKVEILWPQITGDEDNPACLWEVLFYSQMANELLNKNIP